jgi:hypothetical protein
MRCARLFDLPQPLVQIGVGALVRAVGPKGFASKQEQSSRTKL